MGGGATKWPWEERYKSFPNQKIRMGRGDCSHAKKKKRGGGGANSFEVVLTQDTSVLP